MTTLIESVSNENGVKVVNASCNKKSAVIVITKNYISVCCKNANAKLHRNFGGKVFYSINDAIEGYKSSEMKSIINAALTV